MAKSLFTVVKYARTLACPVEQQDRKVGKVYIAVLIDISWWVRLSPISLPPKEHDRKVDQVNRTITIEVW